jgi:hypothetical protein
MAAWLSSTTSSSSTPGGGRENPNLDRLIRPLNLTAPERVALKAFLESLTGPVSEGVLVVGSGWRGHEERPFED